MDAAKLHAVAAFAAGLVITLVLAAYFTPRSWWKRPNARALFIMVAGAWGFGSLILYATQAPAAAMAQTRAEVDTPSGERTAPGTGCALAPPCGANAQVNHAAAAGQPFRVHRDLNLRAAPGVQAARVIVVPAGAIVTPTGQRDGDWWQISATIDGHAQTGWASSLWLRRSSE
ncbi:SH3 domain-containing protein [Duganella sp. FT135W]|uniref:SH3 domain-containing protein n=1 Tax=Duganella flavida TaxID=2692175 RepID=A0A6L8KMQ4_9BURK|nr:SH3 domain-containing protein [Duganella flavida]MYM25881.1 SH3 domain-containing protein [Duganella flavida]